MTRASAASYRAARRSSSGQLAEAPLLPREGRLPRPLEPEQPVARAGSELLGRRSGLEQPPDRLGRCAEALERAGGAAVRAADEREQEVLHAEVAVAAPDGLPQRLLEARAG